MTDEEKEWSNTVEIYYDGVLIAMIPQSAVDVRQLRLVAGKANIIINKHMKMEVRKNGNQNAGGIARHAVPELPGNGY